MSPTETPDTSDAGITLNTGFSELKRSNETLELLSVHNLTSGQALLGDCHQYGLARRQYRTAIKRLARWGFASFKPTGRGTVAKLLDQRVYDINETPEQRTANGRATDSQRAAND